MLTSLLIAVSLFGLGIMAGAVTYTSFVEIPVRQKLGAAAQLENWHLVFPVASGLLKPFGIALFPLVLLTGILTGDWLWYVSAAVLVILVPFTAILIHKTNDQLQALTAEAPEADIKALIKGWDHLHNQRTLITLVAFVAALLAAAS